MTRVFVPDVTLNTGLLLLQEYSHVFQSVFVLSCGFQLTSLGCLSELIKVCLYWSRLICSQPPNETSQTENINVMMRVFHSVDKKRVNYTNLRDISPPGLLLRDPQTDTLS